MWLERESQEGPDHAIWSAMFTYFILGKMGSQSFNKSVAWSHLPFYKIVLAIVLKIKGAKQAGLQRDRYYSNLVKK